MPVVRLARAQTRAHAIAVVLALAGLLPTPGAAHGQAPGGHGAGHGPAGVAVDWRAVDAAMGRPGTAQPGNVRRYGMPRSDLRVTAAGVRIRPGFALGSWLAMTPHGDSAGQPRVMAMGDMVLTEDELAPVMTALQQGGVEQTAVHHHLLRETPRIVYMHVHATGDPVKIARTVRAALARTGTPAQSPAPAAGDQGDGASAGRPGAGAEALGIDTAAIARALGRSGTVNGGVYSVSVPRAEPIRDGGMPVPASMGLATAMNFQPTGGGRAAITGDFVLTAAEVNLVIRTLREHGIEVTSLHNHLLTDEPRLFFLHFWAVDDAAKLARGLRAALDRTNVQRVPAR